MKKELPVILSEPQDLSIAEALCKWTFPYNEPKGGFLPWFGMTA